MRPQGNLKLILIYECLGRQIRVAESRSRSLLAEVRRSILEDSEVRVRLAREVDPVLRIQEEADFRMKKMILDLLLKGDGDAGEAAE